MLNVQLGQFLKRVDPETQVIVALIDAETVLRVRRGSLSTPQEFPTWGGTAWSALYSGALDALLDRPLEWVTPALYESVYDERPTEATTSVMTLYVPLNEGETEDDITRSSWGS